MLHKNERVMLRFRVLMVFYTSVIGVISRPDEVVFRDNT
jgi:hypothetical protein